MGRAASAFVVEACGDLRPSCPSVTASRPGNGSVAEVNASIQVFANPALTVVVAEAVAQDKSLASEVQASSGMLAMPVPVISDFENVHPSRVSW